MARSPQAHTHFARLEKAYAEVADRTWSEPDFLDANLEISRSLFTPESLSARTPRPRALEVFALVSGLPFAPDFTERLCAVQRRISAVLGDCLHYWVAPANLGIEYCVFKWPADSWDGQRLPAIRAILASVRRPAFELGIGGVQVNPDGCVVAKGFDEESVLFEIRQQLKAEVPFLPAKQSGWAHVPLGRILEPLGAERFARLAALMEELSDLAVAATEIRSTKLIHETRWYMEERTVLAEFPLEARS